MPTINLQASAKDGTHMAWPTPLYSKGQINKAGNVLAAEDPSGTDWNWAHDVLSNWRGCHGYPINTFQMTLRTKLKRLNVGSDFLVAQRLKRTPSIIAKLRRFDTMQLSRMQDIGGVRAVVPTVATVRGLMDDYKKSRFKHELVSEKDYIAYPKADGYRSTHLVYRYQSESTPQYNGLLIELQIRTKLQHVWATAVETMSTFLGQALKANQGEREWLRFFEIAGAAFAHIENSPLVPRYDNLSRKETFKLVRDAETDLGVLDKLRGFRQAVESITAGRQGSYHLVILDSRAKTVTVRPYSLKKLGQAVKDYAQAEARAENGEPVEAVLVSAGPVALLRRAYPNYFLDTDDFVKGIESIIRGASK